MASIIGNIADGLTRSVDATVSTVSEAFFEPTLRIGVTGLSRSGKTIFITSLVANLLDRGRMPGFLAAANGQIQSAYLQPQPDDTVPRFDFERHMSALSAAEPAWPESTRSISELRLSLRYQPQGLVAGLGGLRTLHIDIIDYPGEWLLDLSLLSKSYEDWSRQVLERARPRESAASFLQALNAMDGSAAYDEVTAKSLAETYTTYLHAARSAGYSDCTPGRFLMPGDLAGSPVLTFSPLPPAHEAARRSLYREFKRRFDAYKREIVRPFFRDHFSRIDRQVVLVDVLGAIHSGPDALEDLRLGLADTLKAFRPGRNALLSQLVRGKRVERILFAATKADHLHHSQHGKLSAIMESMLREARDRAEFAGAGTASLSLASLRATTESIVEHDGRKLEMVNGVIAESGKRSALYPGELPDDPGELLSSARAGDAIWLNGDYQIMRFAPQRLKQKPGEGPPHIRLDKAAEFLIGDRLR